MLNPSTLPNNLEFIQMKNIIHIDEKWFNGTKKNKNMYKHLDEEDPHVKQEYHSQSYVLYILVLQSLGLMRNDDAILMPS